ncbi:MAG: tRNA lysidine(34) synthetase TilS, partial [Proteiniphilum sp.]|nr:tRNA lysidine(34) synthetase TilS [Proteiniphilum sp.]
SPLGFNTTVIENILQSMDSNPGKVFYSEGYRVVKDRNSFLIGSLEDGLARRESYLISDDTEEITDPVCLAFHRKTMPVEIDKSSNYLYADADKLKFPLKLRRWRQGDWFVPFGMKGKKKLSDYFTDRKFSLPDKEDVWVLLSGDDIVWIVGERSDNRFRITERSINAFIVEYRGC